MANTCSRVAHFISMLRIRFFTIPGPKIRHSCFEAGKESGTFGQGMVKNNIQTIASKKESLRSYVIVARGEAEVILLALCRNILLINRLAYCYTSTKFPYMHGPGVFRLIGFKNFLLCGLHSFMQELISPTNCFFFLIFIKYLFPES